MSPDIDAATGYSIMSAESREDAERLLEGGPIISSVRLCEVMTVWRVAAAGGSSVGLRHS